MALTYEKVKQGDGTVKVTQQETFTAPATKTADTTYKTLAELKTWLDAVKAQKAANDTARTAAASADQAEIDRRQTVYDWAVAQGIQ